MDEYWDIATAFAREKGVISTSSLQRALRIGFGRASAIIDEMEARGMIAPANGSRSRRVLDRPKPSRKPARRRFADIVSSYIVGMSHHIPSETKRRKLLSMLTVGVPLEVRRERKNRHDPNACAVYFKARKIGYIPRLAATYLAQELDSGRRYQFFAFDFTLHALGLVEAPTTGILGVAKP